MDSTRKEAREIILSPSAITQLNLVTVLEPLAQAMEYLATEKWPSLSVVQPLLAALCKQVLKPEEGDPAIILQFKSAVLSSIQHHFGNERQQMISQLASVLDPRYKMLKFLPVVDRQLVHSRLIDAAAALVEDLEKEKDETSPKPKHSKKDYALLDYQESSDSNGSTPTSDVAASALVEKRSSDTGQKIPLKICRPTAVVEGK